MTKALRPAWSQAELEEMGLKIVPNGHQTCQDYACRTPGRC